MKTLCTSIVATLFLISLITISGCGSTSTSGSQKSSTGKVSLSITDAPAMDYSHVYVTVTSVAFHTSSNAAFDSYSTIKNSGWHKVDLPVPKTVDLAKLTDGVIYSDNGASLFDGLDLPVGNYQQIRIFLASTEDDLTASAIALGLQYNNEIILNGDAAHYPLRIPTADEGIRLIPESPVTVTEGNTVKIVLDFNLNNDVVEVSPNGDKEFILKPRLGYFDMSNVGAVRGTVSYGNLSTSRFVIKAEQVKTRSGYRIVRRLTGIDKTTGKFNLYPLPVFGNATTATYDILIRGRNVQTAIVKGVKVHKGTDLNTGVNLGTINIQPGAEFTAQLNTPMHPTGAWLNFYQTIAGDPIPFEVRCRHLNPYTGKLLKPVELSTGPINVATYSTGQALVFTPDTTSQGVFTVVADGPGYYGRGAAMNTVTGTEGQAVLINNLATHAPQITGGATPSSITAIFNMTMFGTGRGHGMGMGSLTLPKPNKGQLFVTHGGMIVDSIGTLTGYPTVGTAMNNGGGAGNSVTVGNIPGDVDGTFYGLYGLGWGNGVLAAGSTRVDLSAGNATARMKMK